MSPHANVAPITVMIAALGGEGGGVLAEWLVDAAYAAGYPAQATSIPGVAQRTGATTYYVEVFPVPIAELGTRRPVLGLSPIPGRVDLFVSSELLETARAIQGGFVSAARTILISSEHRTLTTNEKMQLGDGRVDGERLLELARQYSRHAIAFDMERVAVEAGTVVSAVMLGAIAGSGVLPVGRAVFESVVRAGGRGAEASLRGFARAFELAAAPSDAKAGAPVARVAPASGSGTSAAARGAREFPESVQEIVQAGVARMVDFQDGAYAMRYLDRLAPVLAADGGDFALTRECARFLALWMAFDDVIRVADLKTRASRFARVGAEARAESGDVLKIVDYFKPGPNEVAGLLPASLADALRRWDARRRLAGKPGAGIALHVRTSGVAGFLMLRLLASMRRLRVVGTRWRDEQALIDEWLDSITGAGAADPALALEIALCGRLIKGYGETNERGKANLLHILRHVATDAGSGERAAAVRAAREAALADESGATLDLTLARLGAPARPVVARPMFFMRRKPGT